MTLQYTFTQMSLSTVCKCCEKQGVVVWPSALLVVRGPTQRRDESWLPPEVVGQGSAHVTLDLPRQQVVCDGLSSLTSHILPPVVSV